MKPNIYITAALVILASWTCAAQSGRDSATWRLSIDSAVVKDNLAHHLRGNIYVSTPLETARILSVTGENDVLKIMGSKPGVSSGVEGTNAYFVRGSGSSSARIEMNGVPLSRASHLLGLVSSVPSEIVKTISFAPGGQSSTSGNFTSALIRIDLKDGLVKEKREKMSISPYMGSYYIESPKNKSLTTRLSVRGSLAPLLANSLLQLFKIGKNNAKTFGGAYDIVFTGDWHPTDVLKLRGFVYRTHDIFNYSFGLNKTWLNSNETIAKVDGTWRAGDKISFNADVAFSMSEESHKEEYKRATESNSKVKTGTMSLKDKTFEYSGKLWIHCLAGNNLLFDTGADVSRKEFKFVSHKKNYNEEGKGPKSIGTYTNYHLISLFSDAYYEVEKRIKVKGGIRWNWYSNQIGNHVQTIDVHLLTDIFIKKNFGVEVTIDKNSQFHHVLEGLPSGWGQDIVVASGQSFPNEKAWQFYAGVFGEKQFDDKSYLTFSAGAYSKRMHDLICYVHSSHVFGVIDNLYDNDIVSGTGKAWGLEMMIELRTPKLFVEGSYTYSSANRQFSGINWDKEFHFRFERPHMLNLSGSYEVCRKITKTGYTLIQKANVATVITSGHLMTMTQGRFLSIVPGTTMIFDNYNYNIMTTLSLLASFIEHDETENVASHDDLSVLNNYRLPLYFRVDTGYSFSWEKGKRSYELYLSVVNLLNRRNPYQYFYEDGKWKQISILPIMPTARFVWRF